LAAQAGGSKWLDVCSGTGEMAVYLSRLAGDETSVFASDFCAPMLDKARSKPDAGLIIFAIGDTSALPFQDRSFDLITISFATRNINVTPEHLTDCLREFSRVLRPGGRFINLETSQPDWTVVRSLFHLYVRIFVAPVGMAISRSKAGYAYLSRTIPRFHTADKFAEIIQSCGFSSVSYRKTVLGIAAIHEAVK